MLPRMVNVSGVQKLHFMDQRLYRMVRWSESFVRAVIVFYWALLRGYGTALLFVFAFASVLGGARALVETPNRCPVSLPMMCVGVALIVSRGFRRFAWAFLGFAVLWAFAATPPLTWLLGSDFRAASLLPRIAICAVYVLPPLAAALLVRLAQTARG